jgi:hypothetical protein
MESDARRRAEAQEPQEVCEHTLARLGLRGMHADWDSNNAFYVTRECTKTMRVHSVRYIRH